MLYFLSYLQNYFGPARLFEYLTFRAGGAGFTAFLLVVLLGGFTARKLKSYKTQALNRYEGYLTEDKIDKEKEKTPSMGGILVIGAVIVAAILWSNLTNVIPLILIIATIEFALIGFWDDYRKAFKHDRDGLSEGMKWLTTITVALSVVLALIMIPSTKGLMMEIVVPFKKDSLYIGWFSIPVALAAILGCTHAVNLTDGKDGLASGCMIFSMSSMSIFAYLTGNRIWADYLNLPLITGVGETMVFGSAVVGACVGFLWHNCHPASMFMGDTGALPLGGALSIIAVILRQEILLILVGGVFVLEAGSALCQKFTCKLCKKRFFRCTPLHHHFEKSWGGSWSENQIVVRFWILAGLFALMALATLKLR